MPTLACPAAAPAEAGAVLEQAAAVIEANGWHCGDFADTTAIAAGRDAREVAVCAAGAIRIAAGHDPHDYRAPAAPLREFAAWLVRTGRHRAGDLHPVEVIGAWNDRAVWNDGADAAPEVTAALRQAAAELGQEAGA